MELKNRNKMEVTIVMAIDPNSPSFVGGVDLYMLRLIKQLHSYGVKVTLIGVIHAKSHTKSNKSNYPNRFIPIAKNTKSVREFLFALLLKSPGLKISKKAIIYTTPVGMFPFVLFYGRNPKVCRLTGINSEETICLLYGGIRGKSISWIYSVIEKIALGHVDYCISVSEDTKQYYVSKYPRLKDKIAIIPSGIDLDKFKPMDELVLREKYGFNQYDKIVIYIGRLEIEKNISFLVKAFAKVKKEKNNAKLVLVGDGRDKENLEKLIDQIRVRDVIFMGKIEHDRIPEMINCADVCALCSLYEGSPATVKEALACGVPVVSTEIGDVKKWIIRDTVGRFVDGNEKKFADALIEMMEKNREVVKMACREIAKEFDFDLTVRKTIEVFDKVMKSEVDPQADERIIAEIGG